MKKKRWILRIGGSLLVVCLLLTGISALINRALPAHAAAARLSEAEKARLAEFYQVRQELGDLVWPGWGTADIPVVVYNEAYVFLVKYAEPPDGWLKVPQQLQRGGPWQPTPDDSFAGATYYRQPLPDSGATPQAFTVQVGDRWVASLTTMAWMEISLANQLRDELPSFLAPVFPYAVATRLLVRGSDGYVAALAHESFHAYQGGVAPKRLAAAETAVSRAEANYHWDDPDFETAWQTELGLLAEAVVAETEAEARALAQQFLEQRRLRRESVNLNPTLTDYERQREWLEGLALYVELEIWRQAFLADEYEPVAALQDDPDFAGYSTFNRRWSQAVDQIERMAGDVGDGRFYYSGMAQAVLLDRLLPGWKLQALDEGMFLEDLLAAAVAASDEQ